MESGAITSYIDVAQLVLYAFWIFFAGLVFYLHRENKREGYPLQSDRTDRAPRVKVQGFPAVPKPKTYLMSDGSTVMAPNGKHDTREVKARPVASYPGSPLVPTGNPMLDGVGPAAYAERADVPDLAFDGRPKIVPLRVATDHHVAEKDPDPRGMNVIAADGQVGGVVRDVWVDRSEMVFRYLEVETPSPGGARRVLLPLNFAKVTRGRVKVASILAKHFAAVPAHRNPDQVTLLEEDKIVGYFGGGTLYATAARAEPLL